MNSIMIILAWDVVGVSRVTPVSVSVFVTSSTAVDDLSVVVGR